MSISDQIDALTRDRTLIRNAILSKSGTVSNQDGFDDFASAILTINTGGGSALTNHTILLTFYDNSTITINVDYDNQLLGTMITSYIPQTYNNKEVVIGALDGVEWFNLTGVPIGEELVEYNKVTGGYRVNGDTGELYESEGTCVSDFTKINSSMTFTVVGYRWYVCVFYTSDKQYISKLSMSDGTQTDGEYASKEISASNIPSNAAYIRINTLGEANQQHMSLIRTA